jgi:SAM-dependent methyltransferase
MKSYDKAYFDRFYRHPADRVSTKDGLERKIRLAVSVTEYLLARRIRTVLDIGCGEAPWQPVLRRLRREARYIGVDSSEYVLERYGVARNIKRGDLGGLARLRLPNRIDLIVCADLLQYVETRDIERGLRAIRRLLGGVAYIETFASEDGMEGDLVGWHKRPASEYRRLLERAGLTQCGPYCYVDAMALGGLNAFEIAQ